MNIEKKPLLGARVKLEPLDKSHLNRLSDALRDGELWKIKETDIPHPNELLDYLKKTEASFRQQKKIVFAIIDLESQKVVGCTGFYDIRMRHKKAIIGPTFIASSWQRTHVNTESKYLLLKHAFESWELNRIEFYSDVLNIRSRNAIRRLGAIEEGFLRQHRLMKDGRVRDTVVHSIIRPQWPRIERKLRHKIATYELPLSA